MSEFDDYTEAEATIFDPFNRRTEPRIETEIEVKFTSLDEFVVTYTEDISRGGLFLKSTNFLPVGSTVRLELTVPDHESNFSVIARVAYVLDEESAKSQQRHPGMGMEFLDAENGDLLRQLEAYITLNYGQETQHIDTTPASILLVGDDMDSLIGELKRQGHHVSLATTGMEALGLILTTPFDLILAAIHIPLMDGWQLLSMIRQRPTVAHTTFAFLSDSFTEADNLRAYQQGVDDIIDRNLPPEEIAARTARALARANKATGTTASKSALRGSLDDTPLTSVLSFVELERRTGKLLVVGEEDLATLYVKEGRVIDVDYKGSSESESIDRLYKVLDWTSGRFELTTCEVDRPEQIKTPVGFVLLEHARRSDESAE